MFSTLFEHIIKETEREEFKELFQPISKEEAKSRLMDYIKEVAYQNPDGTWSADGDVDLSRRNLTELPVQFKKVGGGFWCRINKLTSLQGAPKEVGGCFDCSYNQLTSLQGAPEEVGGSFWCYNNKLTSLQGAPKEVGGGFDCSYNQLTTLQGAPKEVGGSFSCSYNQLTSLQGAPEEVGRWMYVGHNSVSVEELKKTISRSYMSRIVEKTEKVEEGKKEDLFKQFVETKKIPEDVFNMFVKSDSTGKQKYLQWMLKQYISFPDRETHIKDVVLLFDNLVRKNLIRGEDSDIYRYSFEELDTFVSKKAKEEEKKVRREKYGGGKENYTKIEETDNYLIVTPHSYSASCFFGANTDWCISSSTVSYWKRYWRENTKIYIIIDKKKNKKYAVAVYEDPSKEKEVYDEKDKRISFDTLVKKLGL